MCSKAACLALVNWTKAGNAQKAFWGMNASWQMRFTSRQYTDLITPVFKHIYCHREQARFYSINMCTASLKAMLIEANGSAQSVGKVTVPCYCWRYSGGRAEENGRRKRSSRSNGCCSPVFWKAPFSVMHSLCSASVLWNNAKRKAPSPKTIIAPLEKLRQFARAKGDIAPAFWFLWLKVCSSGHIINESYVCFLLCWIRAMGLGPTLLFHVWKNSMDPADASVCARRRQLVFVDSSCITLRKV